jgi:glucose-1-phosphate cytidylyltransferase
LKVLILAGGWGTRLGQQTETIPKPMVSIGNKPILWHIMKSYSYYGFHDFIISCGVKAQVIKNYFSNFDSYNDDFTIDIKTKEITYFNSNKNNNWNVTIIDTGINTLKGARIKRVEKYIDSDTNMLTYGDGVSDVNIKELLRFHNSHGKTVTITGVHPPARFGELIENDGLVTSFTEKPQTSVGLINGGYMVFNKELLSYLSTDEKCDLEIGAFEQLVKNNQVMVFKHEGNWECMDHERDVEYLNNLWNKNKAFWKKWN